MTRLFSRLGRLIRRIFALSTSSGWPSSDERVIYPSASGWKVDPRSKIIHNNCHKAYQLSQNMSTPKETFHCNIRLDSPQRRRLTSSWVTLQLILARADVRSNIMMRAKISGCSSRHSDPGSTFKNQICSLFTHTPSFFKRTFHHFEFHRRWSWGSLKWVIGDIIWWFKRCHPTHIHLILQIMSSLSV